MINTLNHNTTYKHSKFSARPGYAMNIYKQCLEYSAMNSYFPHLEGKTTNNTQSLNVYKYKRLFGYQSKELLCWRFDLTFFNLQSFFFGMLRALHTCWTFAKNNKTIVFVSTDNPIDTGISECIDILTQKFPRECLPRIQTHHSKHFSEVKAKYPTNAPKAVQKITKKKNKYPPAFALAPKARVNRNKNPDQIQNHYGSGILSELKNLINAPEFKTHSKSTQESDISEHPFLADWAFHKCDGLLYQAASRRLTASFSHVPASFFSNTKRPFQEKFGIVNSHFFKNLVHKKGDDDLKMLWPLDLNRSCLAKYGPVTLSSRSQQISKPWIKILRSNESDQIQPSHYDQNANKLPLESGVNRPYLLPQKEVRALSYAEKWKIMSSLGVANNQSSDRRSTQLKKKHKKGYKNKSYDHGSTIAPTHWGFKSYQSYDFYEKLLHIQADDARKRHASNPYLQHADLVFFTNADKDHGLASQVKKLGIPSIGIVSGLKTSSYRKQPHQFNLHDSVAFPIVGNPENVPFVMMIVRVFVTLVHNTYSRKQAQRSPDRALKPLIDASEKSKKATSPRGYH